MNCDNCRNYDPKAQRGCHALTHKPKNGKCSFFQTPAEWAVKNKEAVERLKSKGLYNEYRGKHYEL